MVNRRSKTSRHFSATVGKVFACLYGDEVLSNNVRVCFDFPDSIDRDDVGVLEPSGSASLDQVAFAGLLVGLQVHDELDRYGSVENGVVS